MQDNEIESPPLTRSPVFENPYIKTGQSLTTIVAPVHTSDANFIKCIRPTQGTTSAIISTFWKKLVNELAKRNITTVADSIEFERFVLNYHIISDDEHNILLAELLRRRASECSTPIGGGGLPDSAVSGNLPGTVPSNVSTREGSPRDDVKSITSEPSDVQSGSGKKGGRSRKG